jgi:hypothetical protein|tara:strand:- start:829 stop:1788 length:960 start_codon:yes stop_codon:yes gene_type:complete
MKNLAFLGTGKIALEYAKIIKNLGFNISYASSSSQNSKSWKKFKRINPKVKYMSSKQIINHKKIDYIFSLLPYIKQIEYFPKLISSKKNMFIEKPFFHNSKKFDKLIRKNKKNLKNKYISFNRRFYDVVKILKNRIKKRDIKFIRVNINENFTQKTLNKSLRFKKLLPYFGSSSHIIDLLFYLFEKITFLKNFSKQDNKNYPTSYVLLKIHRNIPIFLFIEKNVPLKNGIEVIFKDNSIWSLTPIEKLQIFKGYKITKNKDKRQNYLNYEQRLVYEKKEKSDYKPGLKKSIQYFLKSKKYNQNFSKYHKYLKLYEKIFN